MQPLSCGAVRLVRGGLGALALVALASCASAGGTNQAARSVPGPTPVAAAATAAKHVEPGEPLPPSALPIGIIPLTGDLGALGDAHAPHYVLSTPDAASLREELAASTHPEAQLRSDKVEVSAGALSQEVLPRHREPSFMIDSDQPVIAQLAKQLAPHPTADAIRELVQRHVNIVRYGTFWTASRTARTRSGDCSEHAVLVAALARHAGIPARAVFGFAMLLTDEPHPHGFAAGHMWAQLHDGAHWVDVDATPLGAAPHAYLLLGELLNEGMGFGNSSVVQSAMLNTSSIEVLAP